MAKAEKSSHRIPSKNDVPDNAKGVSIRVLQACLNDGIDLYNATRVAHWNVRGPHFHSIHVMLDEFYNALNTSTDDVAERISQLGATVQSNTQQLAQTTRLPPYPTDVLGGMEHMKLLTERYGAVAKALREGIDETDEAGDADTADLLTEKSREIDKMLWMIESYTKAEN